MSGCCSTQERQAMMTAYKLEKIYGLTAYNRTKTYRDGKLEVYYKNNHDLISCIKSYKEALKIFKSYGYDLSKCPVTIDIRFVLTERVGNLDVIYYGWYDDKTRNIYASRYCSDKCSEFTIMNLSTNNPDVHKSMLLHEISHRFLHYLFFDIKTLDSEYISYVIQVESFSRYLKFLWAKENSYLKPVKTEEITMDNYVKEPKEFGVRMYKHHVNNPNYILTIFKKYERK